MQFTTFSLVTLIAIASAVSAESARFSVMNTRSASKFHFSRWGTDSNGNVYISSLSKSGSDDTASFFVEDDTSVKTQDGKYFVVKDDHSIVLGDKSDATTGFSIGAQEGSLVPFNFNGQNGYVTCLNSDGEYHLYTQNPTDSNVQECTGVASWAEGASGSIAPFPADSASISSSVSSSAPVVSAPAGYQNTSTAVTTVDVATTVVTITSCGEQKCTIYTTTCPITAIPTNGPTTTGPASVAETTPATSVISETSSTPAVSLLVGGAGVKAASSFAAFGALAVALLM